MSVIDRQTVERIAGLANLSLSEEELGYYEAQLGRVLEYIEQLSAIEDGLPSDWRAEIELSATPERDDDSQDSSVIEKVLANAPKVVGSAFQVPRIIE